jgi:hypothetical protein
VDPWSDCGRAGCGLARATAKTGIDARITSGARDPPEKRAQAHPDRARDVGSSWWTQGDRELTAKSICSNYTRDNSCSLAAWIGLNRKTSLGSEQISNTLPRSINMGGSIDDEKT